MCSPNAIIGSAQPMPPGREQPTGGPCFFSLRHCEPDLHGVPTNPHPGAVGRLTWCVPGCQSMLEPCHTLSKLCLEPSAVGLTKFSQVGKLRHHPLQATGMPTRLGSVAAGECDLPACKTSVAMFSSTQASLG